jgi:hypothetical protein
VKPVTVWIFGGRDVGKTTVAMHTAAELRWMGVPTAVTYGSAQLWGEVSPIVNMRIFARNLTAFTPHEAAELCRDSLNFLILRPRYYWDNPPLNLANWPKLEEVKAVWIAGDDYLEDTLRAGHVEYKSLPGVRASTQYLIKKICERVGYDK